MGLGYEKGAMRDATTLIADIDSFYKRWHAFEAELASGNGSVLDFDFCPPAPAKVEHPFANRFEALASLERIRADVESALPSGFSNISFLREKLNGAEYYLRALSGERAPFNEYVLATMGIAPELISEEEVDALCEEFRAELLGRGVQWGREHEERYEAVTVFANPLQFGESLQQLAKKWVARVRQELGTTIEPRYRIETVCVDAGWHNWINGTFGESILLRVNVHPRVRFRAGEDDCLAAHEIAGHALHVLCLSEQCQQHRLESALMNITVHSCEAFQMEGLAQAVMELVAEPTEISPDVRLSQCAYLFHSAIKNNAQCRVEAGQSVESVIADCLRAAPFLRPIDVSSDLRDRSRDPLFRSYSYVYYPAFKMFLRAKGLSKENRTAFLRDVYTQFLTPDQVRMKLDAYAA